MFVIFGNDWFWGFVEVSFQQIFLFPFQQNGTGWPRNACYKKRKTGFVFCIAARKTLFVFVFVRHLLQDKKKQFVFQFGCKLVRGVGLGEAAVLSASSSEEKKRQNN